MTPNASTTQPLESRTIRFDALAGFFVFLIAMPLCLAIARASNFPPIAGIWTAVAGGIITSLISNSQLTIKGPAAGLIVIVAGAVLELGAEFGQGLTEVEQAMLGYRLTLGIGVVAGAIQVVMGLLKSGKLVDLFPLTPVHGMLASIGIIIISKQSYEVFGITAQKGAGPLKLIADFPNRISELNPSIAVIGVLSLIILFTLPLFRVTRKIPAQLVVLVAAVILGMAFDLSHEHTYLFPNSFFDSGESSNYQVGPRFLVDMPEVLKDPASAFTIPDFRALATASGLRWLLLFTLIGSLESLLSAKAIELLDPWKRKTNFDRDLLAVGLANMVVAAIGGLPMISEIVRSKANIDAGARTCRANAFHGLFLLLFVLLCPNLIHRIPLAALGAMLVYTGFRLASPREFVRTFRVGREQFIVFFGTIVVTLAEDLLVGIAFGIVLEIGFHLWHGCPSRSFVKSDISVEQRGPDAVTIIVRRAAIFANWPALRRHAIESSHDCKEVLIDFSETRFIDHTVMEKMHELESEFKNRGMQLHVTGLDDHTPLSSHPQAALRRS